MILAKGVPMKATLRILGLTGAILLTTLASARANTANCLIRCDNGTAYAVQATSWWECCHGYFANSCGYYGEGIYVEPDGIESYCISVSAG
jgi:hypothetical protein